MRHVVGGLAFLILASLLLAEPPREGEVLESFAVAGDGDLLIVPVTIKGKAYPFIVDTGATYTTYDSSLHSLLGKRVARADVLGADNTIELDFHLSPEAYAGKLPLPRGKPAPVYDLASFRKVSGLDIRGVVGMDFLRRYVVRIDFDARRLTFRKGPGRDAGQPLPLHDCGRWVLVEADVCEGGPSERFVIDTGGTGESAGQLQADLYHTLSQLGKMKTTGLSVTTSLGHQGDKSRGQLARLVLGPFEHHQLLLTSSRDSRLGLPFWCRYCVTFDFPAGRVYLRKGKKWAEPEAVNRSGMYPQRHGQTTRVEDVEKDSPAARAGVKPGDELIAIAGRSTAAMGLVAVLRGLAVHRSTLPLTLKRDGKLVEASLQLETDRPSSAAAAKGKP